MYCSTAVQNFFPLIIFAGKIAIVADLDLCSALLFKDEGTQIGVVFIRLAEICMLPILI